MNDTNPSSAMFGFNYRLRAIQRRSAQCKEGDIVERSAILTDCETLLIELNNIVTSEAVPASSVTIFHISITLS